MNEVNATNTSNILYDKTPYTITHKPIFTHLVLGGGGMMGAVYIGVFRYLYERPELIKNIKTVIGTSVGAVFAIIFVLNIPIFEIELFWKTFLNEKNKHYDIDLINVFNIFYTNGLDSNERPLQIILKYIKDITFLDLAKKTGKELVICATNAYTMKPIYFSVDTTPNVLVSDAIYASCAVPLLLKPIKIGDIHYIDGGVSDNVPVSYISKNILYDNILILSLESNSPEKIQEINLPILLLNTILTLIQNSTLQNIYNKRYKYFVAFKNIPVKAVDFKVLEEKLYICTSLEKLDKCFEIGYETMYLKVQDWIHN